MTGRPWLPPGGGVVLLDGAMGTALMARGLPQGVLPERWLLERPDQVVAVHAEHRAAGAEVALTCSFNAHPPQLHAAGLVGFSSEIRRLAVGAARAAGFSRVMGVVGPLRPDTPGQTVEQYAAAAAQDLRRSGVEGLVVETITQLPEGEARVRGAATAGLPVVASVVPLTAAAGDVERLVTVLSKAGADALGVNCAPPRACLDLLREMTAVAGERACWARPSAGTQGALVDASAFGEWAGALVAAGVRWMGGCCGVTARHLAEAKAVLSGAGVSGAR